MRTSSAFYLFLLFIEIYKRGISRARSVTLSKQKIEGYIILLILCRVYYTGP